MNVRFFFSACVHSRMEKDRGPTKSVAYAARNAGPAERGNGEGITWGRPARASPSASFSRAFTRAHRGGPLAVLLLLRPGTAKQIR